MSSTAKADAEALRQLIRAFVRQFGLLDQNVTPCGLPMVLSDAHALAELLNSPGIEPLELSRRLGLTKSAVSRLLIRLRKRGQIRQTRNKNDGRAFNLYLTEKGKRAARMIDRESLNTFDLIVSRLSGDSFKVLIQHLPLLIQALPGSQHDLNSYIGHRKHHAHPKD